MKRIIALLLSAILLLTALGGSALAAGIDGTYTAVSAKVNSRAFSCADEGMYMTVKLGALGRAEIVYNGVKSSEKYAMTASGIKLYYNDETLTGTVENGCMTLEGFVDGIYSTIVLVGDNASAEAAAMANEFAKFGSDGYGRWYITEGTGDYYDMVGSVWDACASVDFSLDGTIHLSVWDSDGSRSDSLGELNFTLAKKLKGYEAVSESGYFINTEISKNQVRLTVNSLGCRGLMFIDNITVEDSYGTVKAGLYLLPWGTDWYSVVGSSSLEAVLPVPVIPDSYKWYESCIEQDSMLPDFIGGAPVSASAVPSANVPAAPVPTPEPVANWREEALAQGLTIPSSFSVSYPNGKFVSFYSTGNQSKIWCKKVPKMELKYRVTQIPYPFNGYYFGSVDGWSLIKDINSGNYYYVYSSVIGMIDLNIAPSQARRGEGLYEMIRSQGVEIPEDFIFSDTRAGKLINSGSSIYAIYVYDAPDTDRDHFMTFYFQNTNNPATESYDGSVICYGSYNGLTLMQSKTGAFFWGNAGFFVPDT